MYVCMYVCVFAHAQRAWPVQSQSKLMLRDLQRPPVRWTSHRSSLQLLASPPRVSSHPYWIAKVKQIRGSALTILFLSLVLIFSLRWRREPSLVGGRVSEVSKPKHLFCEIRDKAYTDLRVGGFLCSTVTSSHHCAFNRQSLSVDKSHLAVLKARRRSNIGVRGSPETNALIRFMAQQRAKTPLFCKTPEVMRTYRDSLACNLPNRVSHASQNVSILSTQAVKSSPSCPRVSSTLKEKMASFQVLMGVEEREGCDPVAGTKQELSGETDSQALNEWVYF